MEYTIDREGNTLYVEKFFHVRDVDSAKAEKMIKEDARRLASYIARNTSLFFQEELKKEI